MKTTLPAWFKQNKRTITILLAVLLIDQFIEYLWFKPLYPDGGGVAERIFWITAGLAAVSFILYQVVNIGWHKK